MSVLKNLWENVGEFCDPTMTQLVCWDLEAGGLTYAIDCMAYRYVAMANDPEITCLADWRIRARFLPSVSDEFVAAFYECAQAGSVSDLTEMLPRFMSIRARDT